MTAEANGLRSLAKYRLRAKRREIEFAMSTEVQAHAVWQRAKKRVRKLEAEAAAIERDVWGLPPIEDKPALHTSAKKC